MMWSQCMWDMNTLTSTGRPRLSRQHVLADATRPLPRSQTK